MIEEKKEIEKNIEILLDDLQYYKNNKSFLKLIEQLNYLFYDDAKLYENILNSYKNEIINVSDEDKLKKISGKLKYYILKNCKEHLNKVNTENSTVYEYEDHYIWFLNNKKVKLLDEYKNLFADKKIIEIKIDGNERSSIFKITDDDLKYSNKVKIKIKK